MTELTTAHSFIVRVYRVDTENPGRITGLLEAMDGSGIRVSFTDIDELSGLLLKGSDRRSSRRSKAGSGEKCKK